MSEIIRLAPVGLDPERNESVSSILVAEFGFAEFDLGETLRQEIGKLPSLLPHQDEVIEKGDNFLKARSFPSAIKEVISVIGVIKNRDEEREVINGVTHKKVGQMLVSVAGAKIVAVLNGETIEELVEKEHAGHPTLDVSDTNISGIMMLAQHKVDASKSNRSIKRQLGVIMDGLTQAG